MEKSQGETMNGDENPLRIVLKRIFEGLPENYIEAIAAGAEEEAAKTGEDPFTILKRTDSKFVNPMVFDITGLTEPEPA